MFAYPERALVNRALPKSKVYGEARPSRSLRQKFITQVEEIVWHYELRPHTLNLPASQGVEGIQIFSIVQRTPELNEVVLRTLDRAIPSLLFFELHTQDKVRFAAAYKRPSEGSSSLPVVEDYYLTPWQPATESRLPLPVALDLAALYEKMLLRYIQASPLAIAPRAGESLAEMVERGRSIRAYQRECHRLEAALRREPQFNRKVEINRVLRQCLENLASLK